MKIYEELKARGLIAQVTDEEQVRDLVNNGGATFYIGFDCTADSLTAGHFMALTLMKRLQMAGNKPIALIGGGTTMIGDPSGRTDMRKMLTKEDIDHNAECFRRQMSRFIEFGEGKARMMNNADWLLKLNYIELLREVGACFSVNNMLRAECYKQRMEKGLSFLEFNYMIMQSYDFYHLFKTVGCNLAVRRRRPVVEYARRHRAHPPQTRQGRARDDDNPPHRLAGQEDGQDRRKRRLARPEQDLAVRFLPVLEKRRRRGRDEVHQDADLPPDRADRGDRALGSFACQ